MVACLAQLLPTFAGKASKTWCFLHIMNLVAKMLMRQFDMKPKEGANKAHEIRQQISELNKNAEVDNMDEAIKSDDQNNEGCVDEMEELTQAQQDNIVEGIQPIHLILMKASVYLWWAGEAVIYMMKQQLQKFVFKIINSTTKSLLLWNTLLPWFKLPTCLMPWDVSTRWNSTFDLLVCAHKYQSTIDAITGDRKAELQQYEMSEDKWKVAGQLQDVLKVSEHFEPVVPCVYTSLFASADSQRHYVVLLLGHTKSSSGYTCHGFHRSNPHNTISKPHLFWTCHLCFPAVGQEDFEPLLYYDWHVRSI